MYLETQRLILRGAALADADFYFRLWNDPFVLKYNGVAPLNRERSLLRVKQDMESDKALYILRKDENTPMGLICLDEDDLRYGVNSLSLSYELLEPFANHGYMTEALRTAVQYAFSTLHADILTARVFSENYASRRVLKKLGFTHEGTLRRAIRAHGGVVYDDMLFSLFKEEYTGMLQEVNT